VAAEVASKFIHSKLYLFNKSNAFEQLDAVEDVSSYNTASTWLTLDKTQLSAEQKQQKFSVLNMTSTR